MDARWRFNLAHLQGSTPSPSEASVSALGTLKGSEWSERACWVEALEFVKGVNDKESLVNLLCLLRMVKNRVQLKGRSLGRPLYVQAQSSEILGQVKTEDGLMRLRKDKLAKRVEECNDFCGCPPGCPGRLVAFGIQPPLEVRYRSTTL